MPPNVTNGIPCRAMDERRKGGIQSRGTTKKEKPEKEKTEKEKTEKEKPPARIVEQAGVPIDRVIDYLFPFALLCVWQSIWQLEISVAPPFDHAVTWSASISVSFQIRVRLAS